MDGEPVPNWSQRVCYACVRLSRIAVPQMPIVLFFSFHWRFCRVQPEVVVPKHRVGQSIVKHSIAPKRFACVCISAAITAQENQ